jgi:pimeloyl-ACP methyl ester carboxylesterase
MANIAFVALNRVGTRPPLFCFVDPDELRDFVAAIPADQPVYAYYPTETAAVEQLALRYLDEMMKIQQNGPYRLGGFSFGGLIAYEIARHLIDIGEEVNILALFDTVHPRFSQTLTFGNRLRYLVGYVFSRLKKYTGNVLRGDFHHLKSDTCDFVSNSRRRVFWLLGRAGGRLIGRKLPNGLRSEGFDTIAAWHRYVPAPYSGKMVLFNSAHRRSALACDLTLGWKTVVSGGIDVYIISARHDKMFQQPQVLELIRGLSAYLE